MSRYSPRPTCFGDECAFHFVHRWAEQLGYRSAKDLCSIWGWNYNNLFYGHLDIQVAKHADVPHHSFAAIREMIHPGPAKQNVSLRTCKICTECLKEDGQRKKRRGENVEHVRGWWFLTIMDVCPIHGVRLISRHPKTAEAFAVNPMNLHRDWDLGFLANFTPSPVTETAAETYVLRRLGLMDGKPVALLEDIPLRIAIELMFEVGASLTGNRVALEITQADHTEALNRGYQVFVGGIRSLSEYLDGLVINRPTASGYGNPSMTYGYLYRVLDRARACAATGPLIELVRRHATKSFPFDGLTMLFGKAVRRNELWTINQVATKVRMSPQKANGILVEVDLLAVSRPTPLIFTRGEVAKQLRVLRGAISLKGVARQLGLSQEAVMSLARQEIIKPRSVVGVYQGKHYFFDKYETGALLRRVRGPSLKVFKQCPNDADPIQVAARRCYVPWTRVLQLLIDGDLRAMGTLEDRSGINAILVKTREVRGLLRARPAQIASKNLAGLIGVPHSDIKELISLGHLTPCEKAVCDARADVSRASRRQAAPLAGDRKTRGIYFDPNAIQHFQEQYISGKEAAALYKTKLEDLLRRLSADRVDPKITLSKPRYSFYLREEVAYWAGIEWNKVPRIAS